MSQNPSPSVSIPTGSQGFEVGAGQGLQRVAVAVSIGVLDAFDAKVTGVERVRTQQQLSRVADAIPVAVGEVGVAGSSVSATNRHSGLVGCGRQ